MRAIFGGVLVAASIVGCGGQTGDRTGTTGSGAAAGEATGGVGGGATSLAGAGGASEAGAGDSVGGASVGGSANGGNGGTAASSGASQGTGGANGGTTSFAAGGTSGAAGASAGSAGAGNVFGVGGGGAGGAASAAGGSSAVCSHTEDTFSLSFVDDMGTTQACTPAVHPMPTEFDASVVMVIGDTITFDTCPPNADCAGTFRTVTASAAGLSLTAVPANAFVHVTAMSAVYEGGLSCCTQDLLIVNLPTWGGVPNEISQDAKLWLAATQSDLGVVSNLGVKVTQLSGNCYPGATGCGEGLVHDEYSLQFADGAAGASGTTVVSMGTESTWAPPSRPSESWRIRDLESFYSGICDDYCSFAYWVTQAP